MLWHKDCFSIYRIIRLTIYRIFHYLISGVVVAENSVENDLEKPAEESEKKSLLGKRGGVFKKIFNVNLILMIQIIKDLHPCANI